MTLETFLLKDKISEINNGFKPNNGWLNIYSQSKSEEEWASVYCSLIKSEYIKEYTSGHSWPIRKGYEGKSNVYGNNTYKTLDNEKIEPFLFFKEFNLKEKYTTYVDVAEEFILYYKLYEEIVDKTQRKFIFVDDYGEKEEIIIIREDQIKIKLKYLIEYITMRDMYFCISFDFRVDLKQNNQNWTVTEFEKTYKGNEGQYYYSQYVKSDYEYLHSVILGNYFISPNKVKKSYLDNDNYECEDFITGIDHEGNKILKNPKTASKAEFTMAYFKKEVLDKYYNNPTEYEIDDFYLSNKYFSLRMDNNLKSMVAVFLTDLIILPSSEQLHWKQYNIAIDEKLKVSSTFFNTMIMGNWAENSEAIDRFFINKYTEFNKKWQEKYGWHFYKPLAKQDDYIIKSLHLISENNIKTFCEQTLTIVKLTIDRLNEKMLIKDIQIKSDAKGITKLEVFLKDRENSMPEYIEFLRNLQSLRSGLIAHSFSELNRDCKKAFDYFKIKKSNLINVHEKILENSIRGLNTLEKRFL